MVRRSKLTKSSGPPYIPDNGNVAALGDIPYEPYPGLGTVWA